MIFDIIMLVYGLYVLYTGKVQISSERIIAGGRARLIGVLCLLPLPVAWIVGNNLAVQGMQPSNGDRMGIDLLIPTFFLLAVVVIALTAPRSEKSKTKNEL
jgi:hypothetical protein